MNRKKSVGWQMFGIMAVTVIAATGAWADSATVSYQGVLRDAALAPVPDGTYPMRFSIWDDAAAGTKRWGDESHPAVATRNGLFSVYLGDTVPLGNVFASYPTLWLQIEADTGSGLEVYNPRVPLASVPYAQYSQNAVPIGTIISVYIGLPGVPSVAEYQARGWALCNGTTPVAQGIIGSPISAALPDLNGQGLFLRGSNTAGTIQGDNVGTHAHTASSASAGAHTHSVTGTISTAGDHTHPVAHMNEGIIGGFSCCNQGQRNVWSPSHGINFSTQGAGSHSHSFTGGSAASAGAHTHAVTVNNNTPGGETRPVNMSVVFFMKVR